MLTHFVQLNIYTIFSASTTSYLKGWKKEEKKKRKKKWTREKWKIKNKVWSGFFSSLCVCFVLPLSILSNAPHNTSATLHCAYRVKKCCVCVFFVFIFEFLEMFRCCLTYISLWLLLRSFSLLLFLITFE